MTMSKIGQVLTLGVMLPFAAFAATPASAGDDQKEGGVVSGAAKGAAAGAILPGVSAKTGAAVGAVSGAVKANKDQDTEQQKDE